MNFRNPSQTLALKEMVDLVRDDLKLVEEAISMESIGSVRVQSAIAAHVQASGGKRLRPILLLLSGRLCGEVRKETVQLAAVVEMIHMATLVHDDVIDMADSRRGRPSTNSIWGNHASVLAGDWLYMQAFQVALRQRDFRVLDALIGVTQLMVEGELFQLERIGRINISLADYLELVDRKTAGLFSGCARLGALSVEADDGQAARLADYAWNVGMAFQLIDDILDFTSRETILGKPVGNDLQEGKLTLPLIYALQNASREETRAIEVILEDRNYERTPFSQVLQIIETNGGFTRARDHAHSYTSRAREIVLSFPDSAVRRALLSITDLVTERDR
jgi:octaprenyl-diphosphate synthase